MKPKSCPWCDKPPAELAQGGRMFVRCSAIDERLKEIDEFSPEYREKMAEACEGAFGFMNHRWIDLEMWNLVILRH